MGFNRVSIRVIRGNYSRGNHRVYDAHVADGIGSMQISKDRRSRLPRFVLGSGLGAGYISIKSVLGVLDGWTTLILEIITASGSSGISTSRKIYICCTKHVQCFKIKRKIPANISSSVRVIVALSN